jgi:hypothetical protein
MLGVAYLVKKCPGFLLGDTYTLILGDRPELGDTLTTCVWARATLLPLRGRPAGCYSHPRGWSRYIASSSNLARVCHGTRKLILRARPVSMRISRARSVPK